MNLSRKNSKFYHVLGAIAALLVPAIAVGLEVPNAFTTGTPIRAADMNENFEAVGEELAALRGEIDALKSRLTPGTPSDLPQAPNSTNTHVIYRARSAGLVTAIPTGDSYREIDSTIYRGSAVDSDNWTILCPEHLPECSAATRSHEGVAVSFVVRADDYFRVGYDGPATSARMRLVWQPLYGDDPPNGGPELVRTGVPPE
jgi:hypothetical protein